LTDLLFFYVVSEFITERHVFCYVNIGLSSLSSYQWMKEHKPQSIKM